MNTEKKANHPHRSPDREANERFVHLRDNKQNREGMEYKRGRHVSDVTAFIRTANGVDYVSFAECDSRDQFCRKTGRVVARRKWFNEKRVPLREIEVVLGEKPSLYEAVLETYYEENA
jgi:hypothetical protein